MQPKVAVTGHGPLVYGKELEEGLEKLVKEFDERAIPEKGRYLH